MGLTEEQLAFIDRQFRAIDNEIRVDYAAAADDRPVVQRDAAPRLEQLLPANWREQAKSLEFSVDENRSIDRILTALRAYRELEVVSDGKPPTARYLAERFQRVSTGLGGDDDDLGSYVLEPLLQLISLERDLRDRMKRALSIDNESIGDVADRLASHVARLVEADITRASRRNDFLNARTVEQLKSAAHAAVDAAKKELALLDELIGKRTQELRFVPQLDENGGIVMSVCSRVRLRRRDTNQVSRGGDDDDDYDNNNFDSTNDEGDTLDTALFSILWQAFKFIVWRVLVDGLPLLVEVAIVFYESGYNESLLATQYNNISFEGYTSVADVPLETWLFGDYGTGLYGINAPAAMGVQYEVLRSKSLGWYETLARNVQHYVLQGTTLALGRDRSFLSVILVAIVVRTVVVKTLQLTSSSVGYLQQKLLSRWRRYSTHKVY